MEDTTNKEGDHLLNATKDAHFSKSSEKYDFSNSKSAPDESESRHISNVTRFEYVFSGSKFLQCPKDSTLGNVNCLEPYRNEKHVNKIKTKLRSLLKRDRDTTYSLHIAAATNDIEKVKNELHINKVSPNTQDHKDRTPLHVAACRGFTEVVRLLLESGANPNHKDCVGNTPLHLAAITSNFDVVTLLVRSGANIFAFDREMHNPIQLAQTKLRHLQKIQDRQMLSKTKDELSGVISMLVAFLAEKAEKEHRKEVDELSEICSHITLSNTVDEVRDDVEEILNKINTLNL